MMTLVLTWGCSETDELINESVKQNKSTYMGLYIKTYGGFTPQEIEEILPGLVYETNVFKSVDYIQSIGVLLGAVKELNNKIKNLENL